MKNTFPLIIAEMSGNHNQSLERALEIVDAAAKNGADALKIQTYTADTMTIDSDLEGFVINDEKSIWNGRKLYDLYKEAHTPWQWHKPIFDRCKQHGIIGFSTPFDETSVDFLKTLNVPMYKIASFELIDIPLIKAVAKTAKPIIMSTGMATIEEIGEAVECARTGGCRDITLLKCTSTYPSSPEDSNLLTIPDMAKKFGCKVGISDHTLGIGVSIASVSLGATVIEKHFTLKRSDGGVDSVFSIEPNELNALALESKKVFSSLGTISYGPTKAEEPSLKFRRSLYVVKDIKKGEKIDANNIKAIRPGFGLPPKYLEMIAGKKVRKDISRGTPVSLEFFEP